MPSKYKGGSQSTISRNNLAVAASVAHDFVLTYRMTRAVNVEKFNALGRNEPEILLGMRCKHYTGNSAVINSNCRLFLHSLLKPFFNG